MLVVLVERMELINEHDGSSGGSAVLWRSGYDRR
jgi:hypothetical protein